MNLGVPSPYTVTVHPYPTRFHGGIWTRPVTQSPLVPTPHAVFKPGDFAPAAYARYPFQGSTQTQMGVTAGTAPSVALWVAVAVAAGVAAVYLTRTPSRQ